MTGQTLLAFVMPFYRECKCKKGSAEDDVVFAVNQNDGMVIIAIRRLGLLAHYGDCTAVMVFVFDITHPPGASLTQPISIAMQSAPIEEAPTIHTGQPVVLVCSWASRCSTSPST